MIFFLSKSDTLQLFIQWAKIMCTQTEVPPLLYPTIISGHSLWSFEMIANDLMSTSH